MSSELTVPSLEKIFRAESLAIVGASPQAGSARNSLVKVILKHGFPGRVYPVSPSHTEIEGLTAYKSVKDLPEVPDVALIITPAKTVAGIIDECGEVGIKNAIIYSSGFEEVASGKVYAQDLAAAAKKAGMAVIGPNCQGIWSTKAKTLLTFGSAANALDKVKHSPVAVISQSGALSGAIGNYLQKSGIGCSYIVSVGNETCLDALDALGWIIEQDDVRVVALYLEGLHDASRLLRLSARARQRNVQIVALKAGRSAFGQEATASHTGKIASPYAIYLDVLQQAGIIVVESLAEAMAAVEVLSFLPNPRTSGDPKAGITVLSMSGGAGALLADHCEESGLRMAEFHAETSAQLETILPDFARKQNPVDLTGQIRGYPNLFRDSLAAVLADERTEAIVIQFASSGMRDLKDYAEVFKSMAKSSGLPIILTFAAEIIDVSVRTEFRDAGIILSDDPSNSMRALKWVYYRQRMSQLAAPDFAAANGPMTAPETWEETMSYLKSSGVTPAKWAILSPKDNAASACGTMSLPVVVKALPSEAEHKTELGLVKLRVASFADADGHAAAFRQALGKPDMGVLVQEMVTDGVEVVLSCLRKTDFGPILSIGSGGVAVELYRDVAYLALPCTAEQVTKALQRLKLWTLLQGFRGQPAADVEALVKAAVSFGDHFIATPALDEIEVNPVLVRPRGKGLAAVDCLITATN